jgi:hypothetical protein
MPLDQIEARGVEADLSRVDLYLEISYRSLLPIAVGC